MDVDNVEVSCTRSQNLSLYIVSVTWSDQKQKANILKIGADS